MAFVLALQTGLIEIEMPARIGAFSIILFVVVASLLQSCLDLTQPVLLSLPATHRRPIRHLPALALVLLLLLLPLAMVHGLLTRYRCPGSDGAWPAAQDLLGPLDSGHHLQLPGDGRPSRGLPRHLRSLPLGLFPGCPEPQGR